MKVLIPEQARRRLIETPRAVGLLADAAAAVTIVAALAVLTALARRAGAAAPDWRWTSAVLVPLFVFLWERDLLSDVPPLAWSAAALGAALLGVAFAHVAALLGPSAGRPTSFVAATLSSPFAFRLWSASRLLPAIFLFSIGALVRTAVLRLADENSRRSTARP